MGLVWKALPLTWKAGLIVGAIALIIATWEGITWKIAHDAVDVERAKIEVEKNNEITKANQARDRLRDLCAKGAAGCVPEDYYRD